MTKKDIILGNYYSSKQIGGDRTFLEKKYMKKNKSSNKNNFNLEKEIKGEKNKKSNSKINIKKNRINRIINEYDGKSFNEEKSKDFIQYKNNSLIKHFMENTKQQSKRDNIKNKINYSKFLNVKNENRKKSKNQDFLEDYNDGMKHNHNNNSFGFKSKKERDKKIENEALEYLKLKFKNNINKNNINKNRLINSSGVEIVPNKKVLNKNNKKNLKMEYIYKNKKDNIEKENEIMFSYMENKNKKMIEKAKKNIKKNGFITERNKVNNIQGQINKKI